MEHLKKFLFIALIALTVSCAPSHRFLGTKQTGIAVTACPVYRAQCTIFYSGLSIAGSNTVLSGTYQLQKMGKGGYKLSGTVSLSINNPSMVKIRFMDLTFVLLEGDLVIHEEKIRVQGDFTESIEFSKVIDTDVSFDSSAWAWFNWRS